MLLRHLADFPTNAQAMSDFKTFVRSGHWPTLAASFLYFDFCFAIWVLNGAMGPLDRKSTRLNSSHG